VTPELAEGFPLLRQPAPLAKGGPRRAAVILLTSNRGLAGGFNANLIKEARRRMEALEAAGYTVDLHAVGKKGIGYFRYIGRALALQRLDVTDNPTPDHAAEIMAPLIEAFEKGELASVDLVYAAFISPLTTPPTTLRILPVEPPPAKAGAVKSDYILRPDAGQLLDRLLPLYVRNTMYRGLVETSAAEHGARRTAMKSATDNAGEILDLLKRTYNRQRQAAITQEIAEIVGGAAALQG
jgi:F-type H+-transporting ATPase subunit gamma